MSHPLDFLLVWVAVDAFLIALATVLIIETSACIFVSSYTRPQGITDFVAVAFLRTWTVNTKIRLLRLPALVVFHSIYLIQTTRHWKRTLLTVPWDARRAYKEDFKVYLSVQPTNPQANWMGFVHATLLEYVHGIDVLAVPEHGVAKGNLRPLHARFGKRPAVTSIIPQRQYANPGPVEAKRLLVAAMEKFAKKNRHCGRSVNVSLRFADNTLVAYCATPPVPRLSGISTPDGRLAEVQICHIHPVDGSLHVTLHPEDVKSVITAGWGERHLLAGARRWWLWSVLGLNPALPGSYATFVYAPCTQEEVGNVMHIVEAGARFAVAPIKLALERWSDHWAA